MFTKTVVAAAVCSLLASTVNAHMVIRSPVPYGQSSLNNSPLENDGSDFPCKQREGVYDITQMNSMPVGVPQNLAFTGGATHGGGSCQVSVTLDKEPTQKSEWKVIHSIIGGCPSNSSENLSDDASGDGAAVFQFSVPKGMPNGQYTLAWTWFNKIGNREMYMNCAPIEVTGGADNNDVFDSLPTMFVINIPNEECSTTEGEDFVFPSPGAYVETPFKTALGSATTGSNCAAVTAKGAGAGTAGSVAAPTSYGVSSAASPSVSAYSSSAASPSEAVSSPLFSAPYVVQTTLPASAVAPSSIVTQSNMVYVTSMLTVTASGPAPTQQAQSQVAAPSQYSGTGGSTGDSTADTNGTTASGSCSGGAVACSTDGAVVCIGSDQWGLCDAGCAVPMALASGTSCSSGVISKRGYGHLGRHVRHVRKL